MGECDELGINSEEMREGTCKEGAETFVVVNRDSTLRLPELDATLIGEEVTDSIAGEFSAESASGTFVIFTLKVKNKLHSPTAFDSNQQQVTLVVNENQYTEDFDAENGPLESSFMWQGEAIQPEATQTGTVVFDVPVSIAKKIPKEGNLDIIDFSGSESYGVSKGPIGIIRTYGAPQTE